MEITKKWLQNKNACKGSLDYVCENDYIGLDEIQFLKKLIKEKRYSDANWLIVRLMNKKQKVQYAIFAAEQVLDIFETKHPDNTKPREAIGTAKKWLRDPCAKTNAAAAAAAYTAYAYAADAAAAADNADAYAYAAADAAAYAAAYNAAYADDAAYADAYAYAAAAAADAADAKQKPYFKILNNGISILNS